MLTLALLAIASAFAADFLRVDAAAPGTAVQVNLLREAGGFTGAEVVGTSCADIAVGPAVAQDRAADPANPRRARCSPPSFSWPPPPARRTARSTWTVSRSRRSTPGLTTSSPS